MSVTGNGNHPLKKVENAVRQLPKGLGIRRDDLRRWMGPELRARWGILDEDTLDVVRAKVVIRLEDVLSRMSDPLVATAVRTSFNFSLDPEVRRLLLTKRTELLQSQGGKGLSMRNIARLLDKFFQEVDQSLRYYLADIPDERVRRVVAREEGVDSAVSGVERFLAADVHAPRLAEGHLAVTAASGMGVWLCVFGDRVRLDAYRRVMNPPWTGVAEVKKGAQVVRDMNEAGRHTGIVLNPSPRIGEPTPDLLLLPPELVDELAASL